MSSWGNRRAPSLADNAAVLPLLPIGVRHGYNKACFVLLAMSTVYTPCSNICLLSTISMTLHCVYSCSYTRHTQRVLLKQACTEPGWKHFISNMKIWKDHNMLIHLKTVKRPQRGRCLILLPWGDVVTCTKRNRRLPRYFWLSCLKFGSWRKSWCKPVPLHSAPLFCYTV